MYNVYKEKHSVYGNIIVINIEDNGKFNLPFDAVNKGLTIKRLWKTKSKIRFFINGQIMSAKEAESWANKEYKILEKCTACSNILINKCIIYLNNKAYCSQLCADKDYQYYLDHLDEEVEIDYL